MLHTVSAPSHDPQAISDWLTRKIGLLMSCSPDDVDVHRPFADFTLDSSVVVSVTADLGKWIGRELSVTIFWEFTTIADLANALASGADAASLDDVSGMAYVPDESPLS
jgi:acyl carrier protein